MEKKYIIGNQEYILTTDINFEEAKSDIILNWVYIDLKNGPPLFYKLIEKAGSQVKSLLIFFNNRLKFSDNLSTIPGLTNCNLIIHSIIPPQIPMYNDNFLRIKRTIKTYANTTLARSLSLYIPIVAIEQEKIVWYMFDHLQQINELKKIYIHCLDKKELLFTSSVLQKLKNKDLKKKILLKIKYFFRVQWIKQVWK